MKPQKDNVFCFAAFAVFFMGCLYSGCIGYRHQFALAAIALAMMSACFFDGRHGISIYSYLKSKNRKP